MVIIIGNQKGGAGKSTLTMLLANYLVPVKKRKVVVIDMDYQQSISQKYEKAKILENQEPYEVIAAGLDDYPAMEALLYNSGEQIVLIDLPGKLDDDGLIPVFQCASLVICPFSYDEFTFNSTILFSVVLHRVNPDVKIVYVPNRIKANVRYEIQQEVDGQLNKLGRVTPVLPDRIDFQRANTFQTPLSVIPAIRPVFEMIYQEYFVQPAKP